MKQDLALRNPRRSPHAVALLFFSVAAVLLFSGPVDRAQAAAQQALPDAPRPQTSDAASHPQSDQVTICNTPRNFLHDQAGIWTSPARLRSHDLVWLLPLGAATGAAIATDRRAMTQVVSRNPDFNSASINTSNVFMGISIAAPVVVFSYGHFGQDEHAREAGILSGEAMLDGLVVEQGMKLIFWRERPDVDHSRGHFFQTSAGPDSSFPSSHAVVVWSAASALANETSSRWKQLALYSAAAGVSVTRVLGQQHFPSDVLIGSATGWLIGRYVVHHHHHRPPDH